MQIIKPDVQLQWITPNALENIEAAGRICYKSENKITEGSAGDFVGKIIKRGHEAVIEHASASFKIITDRGISHEIVRHRVASYCQESTRYCNYSADKFGQEISVIEPPKMTDEQRQAWVRGCEQAEKEYFAMLEAGATAQIARSILPTCLKTELIMTANFREWRHFLKLRMGAGAHPQVIEIAQMICAILKDECLPVFSDI